ncbi:hypothetical protein OESDEN_03114 [Oesophagostomum dentatum]|uniref:Uncharacterized protein n=1 Tax=Oesophagostomum dentatum TaxID=61180 RepID=A0A0B1TH70_OESDE|nr:hypothetical protein OESDEN_03114 [Oesophagostomum dentatum]
MYDAESSDDDGGLEEDEVFAQFGEDEGFAHEVEEESEDLKKASFTIFILQEITHTQLKTSELEAYANCFIEYQDGANAKHRTGSASYEKAFLQNVQTTRSVIPFAKIAFPEIQNPDVDVPRQPLCDNRTSMRWGDIFFTEEETQS